MSETLTSISFSGKQFLLIVIGADSCEALASLTKCGIQTTYQRNKIQDKNYPFVQASDTYAGFNCLFL